MTFAGGRLAVEYDITFSKEKGPLAVDAGREENKETVRVEAWLTGDRLAGTWKLFLTGVDLGAVEGGFVGPLPGAQQAGHVGVHGPRLPPRARGRGHVAAKVDAEPKLYRSQTPASSADRRARTRRLPQRGIFAAREKA